MTYESPGNIGPKCEKHKGFHLVEIPIQKVSLWLSKALLREKIFIATAS